MVENPSILVVDDEAVNRGIASVMLGQAGWHADTVEDGASAILAVRRRAYALVLMDIQMPDMDGFEAAAAIRGEGGTMPIVAFTALSHTETAGRLHGAGMDGYIGKPFTAPELLAAVEPWRPSARPHDSARLAALFGEAEILAMLGRFRDQLADALTAPDGPGERRSRAHRVAGIAGRAGRAIGIRQSASSRANPSRMRGGTNTSPRPGISMAMAPTRMNTRPAA